MNHDRSGRVSMRIVLGLAIAAVAIITFLTTSSINPVTGEKQFVALTPDQEIALGLQALPDMAAQHGGLHPDVDAQAYIDRVGSRLISRSDAARSPYQYEFHLLADPETVNAFALPGGQIFITAALYEKLMTEGQLAGVLAHEIGHVIERHSAQRISKQELTSGALTAIMVAAQDPDHPGRGQSAAAIAAVVGQLVNMRYGRDDELESDEWGVRILAQSGYDPRAMVEVMRVLAEAGNGQAPPEFFSTHPNPDNRITRIEDAIRAQFPEGVPPGLDL